MDKLLAVILESGDLWAYLGAAFAFLLAGVGSTKAVGMAGEAGAGVLTEDPDKFVPVMILEALPSTQGIYGFVTVFMILDKIGGLSIADGLYLFAAALPIAIVGFLSAKAQGRVAAASINIIAKRADALVKGIVITLAVEMFAILAVLVSILMINNIA